MNIDCVCPGNEVPFYCPRHGRVENPNWPALKIFDPEVEQRQREYFVVFGTHGWLLVRDIDYPGDYGC